MNNEKESENSGMEFREAGFLGGVLSAEMIIYLLFFVTANIWDWITVLSKREEPAGHIVLAVIWLCAIAGIAVLAKRGKIDIYFMADRTDLVPLVLILILVVIRITIPDISYDTLNYHLFWQDSFGNDIVNYHFFPTRVINSLFFDQNGFFWKGWMSIAACKNYLALLH